MRFVRAFLASSLFLVLLLSGALAAAAAPRDVIEELHATLLKTLQAGGKAGIEGRYAMLEPVLTRLYDFGRMTEVATGSAWPNASDAEKQDLVQAFSRLSVMIYASRFGDYTGERFEITGERQGPRETVLIDTLVHRGTEVPLKPGEEPTVPVTYVLTERDGQWRIVDVLLDQSISELAVRRSEYAGVLRQGGVERLIAVLKQKADALLKP